MVTLEQRGEGASRQNVPFPGRGVVRKGGTSWGPMGWLSRWWCAPAPTARGRCQKMQWTVEEGTFSWLCSMERGLQGRGADEDDAPSQVSC